MNQFHCSLRRSLIHTITTQSGLTEGNYKLFAAELERASAFLHLLKVLYHPHWCAVKWKQKRKVGRPPMNYEKCTVHGKATGKQIYGHLIENSLQAGGAHFFSHVPVTWVGQEELPLRVHRCLDVFLPIDVLLTAVHHSNVTWESINQDTRWEK